MTINKGIANHNSFIKTTNQKQSKI